MRQAIFEPLGGIAPSGRNDWITRLKPVSEKPLKSCLLPTSVARAEALLSPGAVSWAASVADANTARIIDAVPEFGGGKNPYDVLRRGAESLIVRVLIHLRSPGLEAIMTSEATSSIRDMVRRGISYDHILRGVHMTQADLTDALFAASRNLISLEQSGEVLASISRNPFEFFDLFGDELADVHRYQLELWQNSGDARRTEAAREFLAGSADVSEIEAVARYRIRQRHHVAIILSSVDPGGHDQSDELFRRAREVLESFGCSAYFLAPTSLSSVMAWGSAVDSGDLRIKRPPVVGNHILVAGAPGFGEYGFRSSNAEAAATLALLAHRKAPRPDCVLFGDVEVPALMAADFGLLRQFVRRHLGGLMSESQYTADIRRTVMEYLSTDRSLLRASKRLHVSRNTVTYRLKRAEEYLGHPVGFEQHALHTALIVSDLLGSVVLRQDGV